MVPIGNTTFPAPATKSTFVVAVSDPLTVVTKSTTAAKPLTSSKVNLKSTDEADSAAEELRIVNEGGSSSLVIVPVGAVEGIVNTTGLDNERVNVSSLSYKLSCVSAMSIVFEFEPASNKMVPVSCVKSLELAVSELSKVVS